VLTKSKWKKISRDAGGHVYTAGTQKVYADLEALLRTDINSSLQDRMLKDH